MGGAALRGIRGIRGKGGSPVTEASQQPQIEVRGVSKVFTLNDKPLRVLDNVNLQVAPGEFISIVGPSGSGKTTLLNIISGLEEPSEGEVLVKGVPVKGPGPDRGVIFQQYAVFPFLTVAENIAFGLTLQNNRRPQKERDEIVRHYIDLMGLNGFEKVYPKNLSGGMKQRVAIARAYAVAPDILLMDEPFAALDAQTRDTMQEVILDILERERKTVLFITHHVEEAVFLSNRVVVMSARPARVREIVDIPFSYPRERRIRTTPEFLRLREHIESLVWTRGDQKSS